MLDTFGWLGEPALRLVKEIENDAFHPRLGLPTSTRITLNEFLPLLAVDWQKDNAKLIYQWSSMIRSARLRSAKLQPAIIVM